MLDQSQVVRFSVFDHVLNEVVRHVVFNHKPTDVTENWFSFDQVEISRAWIFFIISRGTPGNYADWMNIRTTVERDSSNGKLGRFFRLSKK